MKADALFPATSIRDAFLPHAVQRGGQADLPSSPEDDAGAIFVARRSFFRAWPLRWASALYPLLLCLVLSL